MLRAAVKAGTPLGLEAKKVMDSGALVSDDIIIGLVKERIAQPDCAAGFLFDGFPRTIVAGRRAEGRRRQARLRARDRRARRGDRRAHERPARPRRLRAAPTTSSFNPPKVDGIDDVTGEELIQRVDDQEETVQEAPRGLPAQTRPLVEYYAALGGDRATRRRRAYRKISGTGSVDEITARALAALA